MNQAFSFMTFSIVWKKKQFIDKTIFLPWIHNMDIHIHISLLLLDQLKSPASGIQVALQREWISEKWKTGGSMALDRPIFYGSI